MNRVLVALLLSTASGPALAQSTTPSPAPTPLSPTVTTPPLPPATTPTPAPLLTFSVRTFLADVMARRLPYQYSLADILTVMSYHANIDPAYANDPAVALDRTIWIAADTPAGTPAYCTWGWAPLEWNLAIDEATGTLDPADPVEAPPGVIEWGPPAAPARAGVQAYPQGIATASCGGHLSDAPERIATTRTEAEAWVPKGPAGPPPTKAGSKDKTRPGRGRLKIYALNPPGIRHSHTIEERGAASASAYFACSPGSSAQVWGFTAGSSGLGLSYNLAVGFTTGAGRQETIDLGGTSITSRDVKGQVGHLTEREDDTLTVSSTVPETAADEDIITTVCAAKASVVVNRVAGEYVSAHATLDLRPSIHAVGRCKTDGCRRSRSFDVMELWRSVKKD